VCTHLRQVCLNVVHQCPNDLQLLVKPNQLKYRVRAGVQTALETLFLKTKPSMLYPNSSWQCYLTFKNSFSTLSSLSAA
jgi:hypothetical protein